MAIITHVCPEHKVELAPKQTRKFGTRWECPIRGCSVAWWGRETATPADAATRAARRKFADEFLRLTEEQGERVLRWFEENKIEGPGFLTEGEANVGLGVIRRIVDEEAAARLRDELAETIRQLSEAGQVRFAREATRAFGSNVSLRTCTDHGVLVQARGLATMIRQEEAREAQRRAEEAERRRLQAAEAYRRLPPEKRPVENTKVKRRLDL